MTRRLLWLWVLVLAGCTHNPADIGLNGATHDCGVIP